MENDVHLLELEIVRIQEIIEKENYDYYAFQQDEEGYSALMDDKYADSIIYWMKRLYLCILVYLELRGLNQYLSKFRDKFEESIEASSEILKRIPVDDEHSIYSITPPLLMLENFQLYLAPFVGLSESAEHLFENDLLINILKSTKQILTKNKVTPSNEAEIYREVKWVLDFYFDTRKAVSRFIKKHTNYKPDILIPEIKTAIEYKFVRDSANVDTYLDQLIVDARVYTDDPGYSKFVAVLCLENSILPEGNVLQAWKERKFPSNWIIVTVIL